ncbi:MAG: cupin domain-containing protein [Planctomycetes bacterium]|nr:cupin domain-containing protein [Planctomycetota bacterium]
MSGTPPKAPRLPAAQVFDLAGLVTYADGAVVSRALALAAGGTVTLFAFDRGEELSEHTAPFDALVHVLDGAGEFVVGGTTHRVSTGQVLLMPAGVPHAVKAVERFKMLLTMLRNAQAQAPG